MTGQGNLLDEIKAVADAAIKRVGDAADPSWVRVAESQVRQLAMMGAPFTTDEIWATLDQVGAGQPREKRAMGAIMRAAQAAGLIRATGEYRKSTRIECHGRPVMIWVGR